MRPKPIPVQAAVRCFVQPISRKPKKRRGRRRASGWRSLPLGARVLVFDTETTTDRFQNLLVGCFQIYEHTGKSYQEDDQGLIVGDVLSPAQARLVQAYAKRHHLRIYSREAFVEKVFLPEVYGLGTVCVGFNLPFDLSRLAMWVASGRGTWTGGFTLYLTPNMNDPRIRIRALDSKRAFIGFGSPWKLGRREAKGHTAFGGRFLDLRTLASALTGEGHSLESACRAFGVQHGKVQAERHGVVTEDYLDYNRRDVQATWELYRALLDEWHRHPFAPVPTPVREERSPNSLLITQAFSPATLCKAYLRAMGIRPRLQHEPQFAKRILGWSMAAYYGGRSECHIRRQVVPVVYLDIASQYPTVAVLMGLFRLAVVDRVVVEDATREAQSLLDQATPDDLLDPNVWPKLCVLGEVEPDADILPVRAQYQEGGDYQIGLNVVTAEKGVRLFYMLPDLIASKLLSGKAARIRRAWRFRPEGLQPGLHPVRLLGEVSVDPRRDDFLKILIERRHELQQARDKAARAGDAGRAKYLDGIQHGLKILANSVYGVLAEIDEKSTGAREAEVFGIDHFTAAITREEHQGPYAFSPLAALITSGARLILAMVEAELRRQGATYAFCDTDSVAIVGSPKVVQAVRSRLARLNPYAFGGDLLKLEPENEPDPRAKKDRRLYFYGISAKRYALFNRADNGTIIVRKPSEHGLGHLLSPGPTKDKEWIEQAWAAIVRWARGKVDLTGGLAFADLAALARFPITKPSILAQFTYLNTKKDPKIGKQIALPYVHQVKPFNFMLVAFPDTGDIATGGEAYWDEPEDGVGSMLGQAKHPIRPVAPYESDPRKWPSLPWVDLHTGRPVRLIWSRREAGLVTGALPVQTYRDVLGRYVTHPEAKAAGPDGQPCGPDTSGELSRLHVHVAGVMHIGKESHKLEEVQAGLTSAQAAYQHYVDEAAEWQAIRQMLRPMSRKELAKISGLHLRSIKAILNTERIPYPKNLRTLHAIAERLRRQG